MDVLAAYRWYENQRRGLGGEFREALEKVIESLREKPKSYPVVLRDARRALLKRFPYMVFYREYDDKSEKTAARLNLGIFLRL
jgi:toxin ParE1/3/4